MAISKIELVKVSTSNEDYVAGGSSFTRSDTMETVPQWWSTMELIENHRMKVLNVPCRELIPSVYVERPHIKYYMWIEAN